MACSYLCGQHLEKDALAHCSLNEKVGLKNPTPRYRTDGSIPRCATTQYAQWTSICGVEFELIGVARGIKGKGSRLTFDLGGHFKLKNGAEKARSYK